MHMLTVNRLMQLTGYWSTTTYWRWEHHIRYAAGYVALKLLNKYAPDYVERLSTMAVAGDDSIVCCVNRQDKLIEMDFDEISDVLLSIQGQTLSLWFSAKVHLQTQIATKRRSWFQLSLATIFGPYFPLTSLTSNIPYCHTVDNNSWLLNSWRVVRNGTRKSKVLRKQLKKKAPKKLIVIHNVSILCIVYFLDQLFHFGNGVSSISVVLIDLFRQCPLIQALKRSTLVPLIIRCYGISGGQWGCHFFHRPLFVCPRMTLVGLDTIFRIGNTPLQESNSFVISTKE